jgi:hypothetical protein
LAGKACQEQILKLIGKKIKLCEDGLRGRIN